MADNENGSCFIWKISNFSMLPHQPGERLISPKFVVKKWKNRTFWLNLHPKETDNRNISLYLHTEPSNVDLILSYSLDIEATAPSRYSPRRWVANFKRGGWGLRGIRSRIDIHSRKSLFLPEDTLTVRCEVSPSDEQHLPVIHRAEPVESESKLLGKCYIYRTDLQVERNAITWPIHNIKTRIERQEKTSISIASPSRNAPNLKLSLNFQMISGEACIGFLIKQTLLSSTVDRLFVKCKITVISANGKHREFKEDDYLYQMRLDDAWKFPPFITSSMLRRENYLYADDMLFLLCEFAFSCKAGIHHSEIACTAQPFEASKKRKFSELSASLRDIYESGKFCDIVLKAGGESIPYYKNLLCARSPVFCAKFENDMKVRNSNVVEITDVDPVTLKRMLTHLHSDAMEEDLSFADACKLFKAAHKYDIESLKRGCSVFLASLLSLAIVCDLIILTDAYQDRFLHSAVRNFICSHERELFFSTKWESFVHKYPKLSSAIMLHILKKKL